MEGHRQGEEQERRKEIPFRKTALFILLLLTLGLTVLLVLLIELLFAFVVAMIRNKWTMQGMPWAFSKIGVPVLRKLEEWYFPGFQGPPMWD